MYIFNKSTKYGHHLVNSVFFSLSFPVLLFSPLFHAFDMNRSIKIVSECHDIVENSITNEIIYGVFMFANRHFRSFLIREFRLIQQDLWEAYSWSCAIVAFEFELIIYGGCWLSSDQSDNRLLTSSAKAIVKSHTHTHRLIAIFLMMPINFNFNQSIYWLSASLDV